MLIYLLWRNLNFTYSEKATKFYKIFPELLTVCTVVKSKGKISQNFEAFSEYMNSTKMVIWATKSKCLFAIAK